MGRTVLRQRLSEILADPSRVPDTAVLFIPADAVEPFSMTSEVVVLVDDHRSPHFAQPLNTDDQHLAEIETLRDVILALRNELGRAPRDEEILRATLFYREHDAFIELAELDERGD